MDQRISLATLAAKDVAALTAFYERLGWRAGFRTDEVAFFQLPGIVLGIWSRNAFARELGADAGTLGPGGMALSHNVRGRDEVDRELARAADAGASVRVPAHDTEWGGRSGYFADPEGYLWEIAWNPAWEITSDGATRMTS